MNAGLESDTSRNGKYRLLAELGEGGMARVYLALARGPSGFNNIDQQHTIKYISRSNVIGDVVIHRTPVACH